MAAKDESLLSLEEKDDMPETLKRSLLLEQTISDNIESNKPRPKSIIPVAGFCVKTRTENGSKVFINICQSKDMPAPKDITDKQLQDILESGDATNYRIPLSLGEPHDEMDNSGQKCVAYDVIISNSFYDVIQKRPLMKDFLLTIVFEGLEEKYELKLDRECKVMKNRKFLGKLPEEQIIRDKPKPFIIEMNEQESSNNESSSIVPEYSIIREPIDSDIPEYLVMEIKLPSIVSSRSITLDIGEDRIQLNAVKKPHPYHLDIDLPFTVIQNDVGAQFNKDSHILFITLPVNGIAMT